MTRPGQAGTVVGPGVDVRWRRLRWPVVVVLVVLVASVVLGLAGAGPGRGALDPASADPDGTRALATLLSDRGVPVRRVTTVSAALDARGGAGTLVVPFPDRVPAARLRRLATAFGTGRLVLVAPGRADLRAVGVPAATRRSAPVTRRDPRCDLPAARTAGDVDLGGRTYDPAGGTGCYPAGDGSSLLVADLPAGGTLVVLGDGAPLENRRLDQHGNAALSLLLLGAGGSGDQVVWLVSGPGSAAGEPPSLVDLSPRWLVLGFVQLLAACLVLVVWRGRRLGPPVTEPLPVVVRAAETVEGRAGLYRRAGARDRAADALRAGVLARLVPRLGLGVDPPAAVLVTAVADRAGRSEAEVADLLFGPPPADDTHLVGLADQLDGLVSSTLSGQRTGPPATPPAARPVRPGSGPRAGAADRAATPEPSDP